MARTAAALHILVKHKEQADDILAQLKKGAKFHVLAKKYSTCPSGKKGGDLGEFRQGQMVPAFDKACFQGEVLTPQLVKPNLVGMWLKCFIALSLFLIHCAIFCLLDAVVVLTANVCKHISSSSMRW